MVNMQMNSFVKQFRKLNQVGIVHILPLLMIIAAVGVISFLLLSSAAPFQDGIFSKLFPRNDSKAASGYPTGFTEQQIASGISSPTAMEFAPDGRLFVLQQSGQVRVIKNGSLLSTPFLTLTTDTCNERGLVGIAFDPNFNSNHFIYLYYTVASNVHNRLSRFTASGDVVVPGSEVVIYDFDGHSACNHNGGAVHFGTDGKLYVTTGDNATGTNAQTLTNDHGKLFRFNPVPDDPATTTVDERIPTDNPTSFNTVRAGTFRTESPVGRFKAFYVIGLRNPFTSAIQPGTGKMHINDVGDNGGIRWEEINLVTKGANFGWPEAYGNDGNQDSRLTKGLYWYQPEGCAITGGTFYNPSTQNFPASYVGKYFFSDYCGGWIKILDPSNNSVSTFTTGINQPVDLKVGPDGALYYLAIGSSGVFKVQFGGVSAVAAGNPSSGTAPLNVSFSAQGSTDSQGRALTYSWNFGDGASGTGLTTTHSYAQDGIYNAILTATNTASQTGTATVTIRVGTQQTIDFNDYPGQDVPLSGQYPTGVVNWGTSNTWLLSPPFGQLTTKNFTFNGAAISTGNFTFISPKKLLSLQAYNGGTAASTITLSCAGNTTKTQSVPAGSLVTIVTGWTNSCSQATLASSNGWDTNFDNLVYGEPGGTTPSPTPSNNQAPTATISTPVAGTLYNAGTTISFSGTGTDPEDGNLAGSRFTWVVQRHHDDGIPHTHPVTGPVSGTSGSFAVPTQDEKSVNVFYRISLTVTDSQGLNSVTVTRDVQPRKVNLTLGTNPTGGQLFLDGIGVTTPTTFGSVVGLERQIAAGSPQTFNSQGYNFSSWSDGGAATHTFNTPASNTTYTATYLLASTPIPTPTSTPTAKVGDLDGDGDIDIFDYSTLVTNFGKTGSGLVGDLDHDGDIDIFDYSTLVTNFGK